MDEDRIQRCVICGKEILNFQNAYFLGGDAPSGFGSGDVYDDNNGTTTKYMEANENNYITDCTP
jgi:hypothetical protein